MYTKYMAKIYCDGYTILSNPSDLGGGWVVVRGKKDYRFSVTTPGFTNNEAELRGIFEAAKMANRREKIYSDSRVAIGWVNKRKAGPRNDLHSLAHDTKQIIIEKQLSLEYIPREQNKAGILIEQIQLEGKKLKREEEKPAISKTLKEGDACPTCTSKGLDGYMIKRKGKFGDFLGCSNYPRCFQAGKIVSEDYNWDLIRQADELLKGFHSLIR
jgi:ribonuclease HI